MGVWAVLRSAAARTACHVHHDRQTDAERHIASLSERMGAWAARVAPRAAQIGAMPLYAEEQVETRKVMRRVKKKKRIDLSKPRYDQDSYKGRVKHFWDIVDPRTMLTSDAELKRAVALLDAYERGEASVDDDEELWRAKKIKTAIVHPDTGEKVPFLFRFSWNVPMNIGIVVGMLSSHSMPAVVGWQVINQLFNAGVNFCNRNASSEMTDMQLATSTAAAVTCASGTAIGLKVALTRFGSRLPAGRLALANRLVPFAAVCFAQFFSVGLMRKQEVIEGVNVFDEDGVVYGKSKKAGLLAVAQTIFCRIAVSVPVMALPPLVFTTLEKRIKALKNPRIALLANTAIIGTLILTCLPPTLAIFPQYSTLAVEELEPEFADAVSPKTGVPVSVLRYNKGI